VTLKSEKEQVRALATYLAQMLDKLADGVGAGAARTSISWARGRGVAGGLPRAGWDEDRQRIVTWPSPSSRKRARCRHGALRGHARAGHGVSRATDHW